MLVRDKWPTSGLISGLIDRFTGPDHLLQIVDNNLALDITKVVDYKGREWPYTILSVIAPVFFYNSVIVIFLNFISWVFISDHIIPKKYQFSLLSADSKVS